MQSKDLEIIKSWKKSPLKFAEDVFKLTPQKLKDGISPDLDADYYGPIHFEPFVKGKNITWQQWLIFRAVEWAVLDKAPRFISVASGRGTGKSSSLAMLIIWFLLLHRDAQIPCTAPTADQLHDVLWKEIALWARRMPEALREKLQIQSDVVRLVESPMTWFARARTAKKENPEALSGMHSDDMMYVADESSGIVQEVFDIAVGSMTNKNALFLLTSNPTRLTGYFFESHHKNKHLFQTIHLNSEQSPIVTEEFVKRMESEYGKDTDAYAVHVLGRFPSAEAGQYISTDLFESAVAREVQIIPHAPKILGVDIARMGDDATVATERKGAYSELKFELRGNDTMAVTGRIIAEIEHAREYGKPYDFICVDAIGIGAGVVDRLREQKYEVMAVNVAEKPRIKGVKNLRMELWKRMRDWLSEGHVSKEYVDITHPFYQFDSSGRIILESKKDMKSRGLASCDYGDSLALTFCPLQTVAKQYAKKKERKIFDEPLKGWRAKLRGVRSV